MRSMEVAPAGAEDVPAYLRIRDAAAEGMVASGIDQWRPGELTPDILLDWIDDGDLMVARLDGELVGGYFVLWRDSFWSDAGELAEQPAGYIHGLLIDRRLKGSGLGRALLRHAEEHIAARGLRLARLDTVTTNVVLVDYYRNAGYAEVGVHHFEDGKALDNGAPLASVTLFQKSLV